MKFEMSLNTNQVLKDISTKPFCLSRMLNNPKDANTRIKFNVGCIPKSATNANQAKCLLNIFNVTVSEADADCSIITSNGWANTFAKMAVDTTDCLATCSVVSAPASNITARPSSNTTINATTASMASTSLPSFFITFATLFIVFSVLFSKRAII
ncbi:unnamed protein product [Mucor hiemalis]